jgi:hypothetical protein
MIGLCGGIVPIMGLFTRYWPDDARQPDETAVHIFKT